MGELKSAYERAMEKAEKLGQLSPEELRERKKAELAPIGRALADRYLSHGHTRVLSHDLERFGDEERDVIANAAWGDDTIIKSSGGYPPYGEAITPVNIGHG